MLLEVCANSYQSAINAQDAGAHRIELCQELAVGGVTPSYGLIKRVVKQLTIPVFVLIRPRSGHFVYTDDEFEIMKADIQSCKDLSCAGIVSGVLNSDNTIDIQRTQELIELSRPLAFTFHRAFDEVKDPIEALNQLIDLGVERVLTSGQKPTAVEGVELLKILNNEAKDRISLLIGSGVNADNALQFKTAGFSEVHASASSTLDVDDSMFSEPITYSDPNKIKSILNSLSNEI